MIHRTQRSQEAEVPAAVILAFRPRAERPARRVCRAPAPMEFPDAVDLAKEPGLPERLRDLLNG